MIGDWNKKVIDANETTATALLHLAKPKGKLSRVAQKLKKFEGRLTEWRLNTVDG